MYNIIYQGNRANALLIDHAKMRVLNRKQILITAMKKLLTLSTLVLFGCFAFAQVDVGKAKSNVMGKGKLVAMPVSELLLDNFTITFNMYKFDEDRGANGAQVGVRARLGGIDEALAQEIANESYAYFIEEWKKRNVKITMADKSVMMNSKPYKKGVKKGNAKIVNGGIFDDRQKKSHIIQAWPEGVDIAFSGSGLLPNVGNAKHMWPMGIGNSTGFTATIDFISFKTAALGSTASVKSRPQLSMLGGLTATIWSKNKVGGYIGSIETGGSQDYYTGIDNEGMEFLGAKVVDDVYMVDKAKFKENVLNMIKQSMNAQFADYDAVVAKNRK